MVTACTAEEDCWINSLRPLLLLLLLLLLGVWVSSSSGACSNDHIDSVLGAIFGGANPLTSTTVRAKPIMIRPRKASLSFGGDGDVPVLPYLNVDRSSCIRIWDIRKAGSLACFCLIHFEGRNPLVTEKKHKSPSSSRNSSRLSSPPPDHHIHLSPLIRWLRMRTRNCCWNSFVPHSLEAVHCRVSSVDNIVCVSAALAR